MEIASGLYSAITAWSCCRVGSGHRRTRNSRVKPKSEADALGTFHTTSYSQRTMNDIAPQSASTTNSQQHCRS